MKFILNSYGLLLLIMLSLVQGGTSCTKDNTISNKDTAMTAEILTANPWKPQELRAVYGDFALYYLRGNSAISNQNFDIEYFIFNSNGTGLSIDANGYSHDIKDWKFVNTENTKLTFKYYVTNSSIYHDMTWENIRYKNKTILADEYWHDNYVNKNYHGQAIRIPK